MYSFTDIDIDNIDPSSAQKSLPPLSSMFGVMSTTNWMPLFDIFAIEIKKMCDAFHKLRIFSPIQN